MDCSGSLYVIQLWLLLMPQRGYVLQPRVAASATLRKSDGKDLQPQRGCVICFGEIYKAGATALRLKDPTTPFSQGSRATRQPWAGGHSPVGASAKPSGIQAFLPSRTVGLPAHALDWNFLRGQHLVL